MKKLFFAVFALAALSLLAPSTGFAQTAWNQLGIYTDMAGDPASANFDATLGVQFNAYLVLTNPVNESFNGGTGTSEPITGVDGFECKVTMPASTSFIKLSSAFPVSGIDIGDAAAGDFVVGFATSVPVVGNSVILVTYNFLVLAPGDFDIFMDITDIPSIAGTMAIVDSNDKTDSSDLQSVFVSTNDSATPVFSVNGNNAVATEAQTFGGVKSLFR